MQRLIRCSSHLIFAPFSLFPVHSLHFFFFPKVYPEQPATAVLTVATYTQR